MALTKVTNSMIEGASLNVLDFGADPTGATNSQAAFDLVISIAQNTNVPVYIPEGTFLLDAISWTNGAPVGNGNKYGPVLKGAGISKTFLKASGAVDKFLGFFGAPGLFFLVYPKAEDFTIDMENMPNSANSIGIYQIYTYGGSFNDIKVKNQPSNAVALYLDQGCYTNVWTNCDFGGTEGRLKVIGIGIQPVTTQRFICCSWGQYISDNAQTNEIIACTVQGDLSPKFQLSEQYGLSIIAGDFEGSGVLYAFGSGVNAFYSINAGLVGFTGTYSTGSINTGMLLDQIYPLTSTGNPFQVKNLAVSAGAAASGYVTAMEVNGAIAEKLSHPALLRKVIENTNATSQAVDIEFNNANGSTFVGQNATGDTYIDARGTTKIVLQQNGTDKLGVTTGNNLLIGTATSSTVGAAGAASALPATPSGYVVVSIGGTPFKIPYYAS